MLFIRLLSIKSNNLYREYEMSIKIASHSRFDGKIEDLKRTLWTLKPLKHLRFIFVEPTNVCNLNCIMCDHESNSKKRSRGFMDFNVF